MNWIKESTLNGNHVILQPLKEEHESGLKTASSDGELWNLWYTTVPEPSNTGNYIKNALNELHKGVSLPFVVLDKNSGKVLGSTRYMNIDSASRRLEIGSTWYAKSVQRTCVNTECKLLLLTHAFEVLDCVAVEFRTHFHNLASRTAIARLGAKQDGILRNHRFDRMGNLRDTVVFSIIQSEWPTVKYGLEHKLKSR